MTRVTLELRYRRKRPHRETPTRRAGASTLSGILEFLDGLLRILDARLIGMRSEPTRVTDGSS